MRTDPDCIFCKIVAGTIPCFKLVDDAHTLAFMDINPGNPGHALAIAKEHWENLSAMPPALLGPVLATAQRVAKAIEAALAPDGINLLQANGPGAAQSVFHFHIHILPRRNGDGLKMNWGHAPGDMAAIKANYEKIRAAL
ncbi:MAG: HIT family protein [Rhodospirillaceae bacterium]|nr:HIT family protein [Rhodospirillaceae bacterium]